MAAVARDPGALSQAEVREIIASLIVERSELLKAGEAQAAGAIELAIAYWQDVLAKLAER